MTVEELLEACRDDLDDLEEPYKWETSRLIRLLNEAEVQATRRSTLLIDKANNVTLTGSSNISFGATLKTITYSGGGLLSLGFYDGCTVAITGTTNNNITTTVTTVTNTQLVVTGTLIDEASTSATITVTSNICILPVSANNGLLSLDRRVRKIIRVKLDSLDVPLVHKTMETLDDEYAGTWESLTGTPYACCVIGDFLRLVPISTTVDVARLITSRLPLKPMKLIEDSPEIPSQYHMDLIDWVLYRAYRKNDSQSDSATKAADHLSKFESTFGKLPTVSAELGGKRLPLNLSMRAREFGT
jgi:hypothetical protein